MGNVIDMAGFCGQGKAHVQRMSGTVNRLPGVMVVRQSTWPHNIPEPDKLVLMIPLLR